MLWVYPYVIMTEAYFYLDVIGELDGTGTSQSGYDAYGYHGDFYGNDASYGGPSSYDGSRHTYPHGDRHASDYIEYPEDTYHVSSDRSSDEERN